MNKRKPPLQQYTTRGQSVTRGDITITPQAQALVIRWPNGGWVWNRPTGIDVVQGPDTTHIPIIDVSRIIQLSLLGLSCIFLFITLIKSRRESNE